MRVPNDCKASTSGYSSLADKLVSDSPSRSVAIATIMATRSHYVDGNRLQASANACLYNVRSNVRSNVWTLKIQHRCCSKVQHTLLHYNIEVVFSTCFSTCFTTSMVLGRLINFNIDVAFAVAFRGHLPIQKLI